MTNPKAIFLLGQIHNAKINHLFIREKHKVEYRNVAANLESAKHYYNIFGMYEDCGPSYEQEYEEAKILVSKAKESTQLVISMEKHFKKLKHEFVEKFPEENLESLLAEFAK